MISCAYFWVKVFLIILISTYTRAEQSSIFNASSITQCGLLIGAFFYVNNLILHQVNGTAKSVMCNVIKIRLLSISFLGVSFPTSSVIFFLLWCIFMTSHMLTYFASANIFLVLSPTPPNKNETDFLLLGRSNSGDGLSERINCVYYTSIQRFLVTFSYWLA